MGVSEVFGEETLRIILLNAEYFVKGGVARYLFNIKNLLESKGHTVIPFSVQHNENEKTEWSKYFLSPIGKGSEVHFKDFGIKSKFKYFSRMFYSFEAKRKLEKLILDTKPDIIYALQYHKYISCSVISVAKKHKIPFVHRISDFGAICPNYYLYSFKTHSLCEKCVKGSFVNAIKNRCGRNIFAKTLMCSFYKFYGVAKKTDAFVFTCEHTKQKFIEAGYQKEKCFTIPTFFNKNLITITEPVSYEPFALFIGRLDREKGVEVLIDAFLRNQKPLKIIGLQGSDKNYNKLLNEKLRNAEHKIELLGQMNFEQIQTYLSKCLFTICPANWYENLPNAVLESYAFKKCVVATNIGSLKDAVKENETGLLFERCDAKDLANKAEYLFENKSEAVRMGENAGLEIENVYCAEGHYGRLMGVFKGVMAEAGRC